MAQNQSLPQTLKNAAGAERTVNTRADVINAEHLGYRHEDGQTLLGRLEPVESETDLGSAANVTAVTPGEGELTPRQVAARKGAETRRANAEAKAEAEADADADA
ncbi:MAG: hypothetical protein M3Q39_09995 [Actinomycetota bacterium]|nr:hypothetical protein [Actinomycetota bacterium]